MADKDRSPEEVQANLELVRHIPAWLKRKRKTQQWLADGIGKSTGTVSKWLSGQQGVSAGQLYEVAQLLGVEVRLLLSSPDDISALPDYAPAIELLLALSAADRGRWLEFGRNLAASSPPNG